MLTARHPPPARSKGDGDPSHNVHTISRGVFVPLASRRLFSAAILRTPPHAQHPRIVAATRKKKTRANQIDSRGPPSNETIEQ